MTKDQRTTRMYRGRAWPALDWLVFGGSLAVYAAVVPLGLARIEAAPHVSAAVALEPGQQAAPLALLLTRLLQYLPVGDVALRANLLSCACAAGAVALVARLSLKLGALFRPPPSARQDVAMFLHEPVAAAGAALTCALSVATFEAGITAGSTAMTLLVLLSALLAELALLRDIGNTSAGLALASLAGLSAAVGPMVGPVVWPVLVGLGLWALRKGSRWPLFAPLCFLATLGGFALATTAASLAPLSLREVFVSPFLVAPQGRAELWMTALEIGDQVGVVGVLLAVIGMAVLFSRAAVIGAWLTLNLVTCLLFANLAETPLMPVRAAFPMAIAATCLFACVGLVHVSSRLGRARLAAASALAVILAFPPAIDGGRARWVVRPVATRLLDRALDKAETRAVVDPGTAEMAGLFSLARAIGLRPDLEMIERPTP
jgi:hypothetical protein